MEETPANYSYDFQFKIFRSTVSGIQREQQKTNQKNVETSRRYTAF